MTNPATVVPDDEAGRQRAVQVLRSGGVVALPTDTVYGIAVALPTPGGIERLFAIKRRPLDKGIALLLDDVDQADELGEVTEAGRALAAAHWPGGLTLVLQRRPAAALPDVLTGGVATVGVRVPAHAAPRTLARALGPLPTTSANVSGLPEAPDAAAVLEQLGDELDLILDGGPARAAVASTVVDVSGQPIRILRSGAIGRDRIEATLRDAGLAYDVGR